MSARLLSSPLEQATDVLSRTWAECVADAVAVSRRSARRECDGEVIATDQVSSRARIRTWLYEDVHLRRATPLAGTAPVPAEIATGLGQRWRSYGWHLLASHGEQQVVDDGHGLSLVVPADLVEEHAGDVLSVLLPRLRANVALGWHGVTSLHGPATGRPVRLYLSGWSPDRFTALVRALDRTPAPWTAKCAADADTARPDGVVVYFASDRRAEVLAVVDRLDVGPVQDRPGFSLRRGRSIGLGGSVSPDRSASFGSLVADEAAGALIDGERVDVRLRPLAAALLEEWS